MWVSQQSLAHPSASTDNTVHMSWSQQMGTPINIATINHSSFALQLLQRNSQWKFNTKVSLLTSRCAKCTQYHIEPPRINRCLFTPEIVDRYHIRQLHIQDHMQKSYTEMHDDHGVWHVPLSGWKSIVECSYTPSFLHDSGEILWVLKISPLLFPNTWFLTFKQHLQNVKNTQIMWLCLSQLLWPLHLRKTF